MTWNINPRWGEKEDTKILYFPYEEETTKWIVVEKESDDNPNNSESSKCAQFIVRKISSILTPEKIREKEEEEIYDKKLKSILTWDKEVATIWIYSWFIEKNLQVKNSEKLSYPIFIKIDWLTKRLEWRISYDKKTQKINFRCWSKKLNTEFDYECPNETIREKLIKLALKHNKII